MQEVTGQHAPHCMDRTVGHPRTPPINHSPATHHVYTHVSCLPTSWNHERTETSPTCMAQRHHRPRVATPLTGDTRRLHTQISHETTQTHFPPTSCKTAGNAKQHPDETSRRRADGTLRHQASWTPQGSLFTSAFTCLPVLQCHGMMQTHFAPTPNRVTLTLHYFLKFNLVAIAHWRGQRVSDLVKCFCVGACIFTHGFPID